MVGIYINEYYDFIYTILTFVKGDIDNQCE